MITAFRLWLTVAGLSGLAAVALGAYGSHGLKGLDPELLARFDTALRYQFVHTLALLAVVILALSGDTIALRVARWAFLVGMIGFCGSLYGSALLDLPTKLAPLGGLTLMLGWLAIVVHAWLAGGR